MKKINPASRYNIDPLIHHPRFYDQLNTFGDDIPFYLEFAKKAKGDVLELCAGTGRITIPLAQAGIPITAVDISQSMLAAAKRKARAHNLPIPFIRQDMRRLRLNKKFAMIFIPFNSLQCIYSMSDIEKILGHISQHLTPSGIFVFDIFNPSISLMYERSKHSRLLYRMKLSDGNRIKIWEQCAYDSGAQINRVTWQYQYPDGKRTSHPLDMRCFYPQEMDAILKYNHFKIIKKFGQWDKTPFSSQSRKQIFLCKKI